MTSTINSSSSVKCDDVNDNFKGVLNVNAQCNISPRKVTATNGCRKSGKFWKDIRERSSSLVKTRGLRQTLQKKEKLRQDLKRVKEKSRQLKQEYLNSKEAKKERRRENLKRQEENRKRSEIVQVIKNTSKLKRMKKKHLRNVEKRDTLNVKR